MSKTSVWALLGHGQFIFAPKTHDNVPPGSIKGSMENFELAASLEDWAAARLALTDIEYGYFRVPPQITLEILLIILANGGSCDLSSVYQYVRATHPAIRQHLRLLQKQDLVVADRSSEDGRARKLTLSQKAHDMCREYLETLQVFLQR